LLLLGPLVLGVASGLVAGGKLANWARVRLRWPWLVVAALVVRLAVLASPLNSVDGTQYVYAAWLAILIGWCAWNADRLPGVWLVAAGTALNLVVILANDSRMPVAATAGILVARGHVGQYVLMDSTTHLAWLGDWITVPGPLGGVYSPGDLVVGLGIGIVSFLITRPGARRTKLDETSTGIGS
jgi:hypothetical protein